MFTTLVCLVEEGIGKVDDLRDEQFRELIRKQYKYVKAAAREGFY